MIFKLKKKSAKKKMHSQIEMNCHSLWFWHFQMPPELDWQQAVAFLAQPGVKNKKDLSQIISCNTMK